MACTFCDIVAGKIPSERVYEDSDTIGFLDIRPHSPGHTLIIPKVHADDLYAMDDASLVALMRASQTVAKALRSTLHADGLNFIMNNGAHAGQIIFHAHAHLIPRFKDRDWREHYTYAQGEAEETAKKIRQAFNED